MILSLPRPVVLLLRYLFAFLAHLSECADENMMDPYNLAICFAPTLLPIPHGHDQVRVAFLRCRNTGNLPSIYLQHRNTLL